MDQPPDKVLVKKCKDGDREAFGMLVNRYKKRIYYLVYQMTNNYTDADDLSQEIFIKTYNAIQDFGEKSSFYTWLYRIAVNTCLNHLRCNKKKTSVIIEEYDGLDEASDSHLENNNKPINILMNKELSEKLTTAIDSLPLPQKTAVVLCLLQNLSYKDAAQIENCSVGTISWRIYKARRRLKVYLLRYIN